VCTTASSRAGRTAARWRGCARVRTHVHDEVGVPQVAKGLAFVSLGRRTHVRRLLGERGGATRKQQFGIGRVKIGTVSQKEKPLPSLCACARSCKPVVGPRRRSRQGSVLAGERTEGAARQWCARETSAAAPPGVRHDSKVGTQATTFAWRNGSSRHMLA
jgi:hypothetical protein